MKYFELTPHYIRKEKINKIDFDDRFFASLKEDYSDFSTFFNDCQDYCYTSYDEAENIDGFLYFVIKDNYSDVLFFKVLEFGNKIEEAFLKIIIKEAKANNLEQISISVFRKEQDLVTFLEKFSFNNVEIKENRTSSGFMDDELVFIKNMSDSKYPNIDIRNKKIFLIPLTSSEHEKLFPEAEKMYHLMMSSVIIPI